MPLQFLSVVVVSSASCQLSHPRFFISILSLDTAKDRPITDHGCVLRGFILIHGSWHFMVHGGRHAAELANPVVLLFSHLPSVSPRSSGFYGSLPPSGGASPRYKRHEWYLLPPKPTTEAHGKNKISKQNKTKRVTGGTRLRASRFFASAAWSC
eukprot:scaffold7374_cov112-Isochrysis_galbana.AAC.11